LHQAGAEKLKHLGELRAQFERAAKRLRRLLVLAVFQQELAQAKMAQLVIGIIAGHLAKLGDAFLQLRHALSSSPEASLRASGIYCVIDPQARRLACGLGMRTVCKTIAQVPTTSNPAP